MYLNMPLFPLRHRSELSNRPVYIPSACLEYDIDSRLFFSGALELPAFGSFLQAVIVGECSVNATKLTASCVLLLLVSLVALCNGNFC